MTLQDTSKLIEESSLYDSAIHDVLNFIRTLNPEDDHLAMIKEFCIRAQMERIVHSDAK